MPVQVLYELVWVCLKIGAPTKCVFLVSLGTPKTSKGTNSKKTSHIMQPKMRPSVASFPSLSRLRHPAIRSPGTCAPAAVLGKPTPEHVQWFGLAVEILWMNEILHYFETMVETIVCLRSGVCNHPKYVSTKPNPKGRLGGVSLKIGIGFPKWRNFGVPIGLPLKATKASLKKSRPKYLPRHLLWSLVAWHGWTSRPTPSPCRGPVC